MATIHVVTDSACDLSESLTEEHAVTVVPLTIRFGEEELTDRSELSAKEFWDRVVTGGTLPQTAAPAPGAFQQAFLEASAGGADGVLCITLSSGVSATYQAAMTAAEAVRDRVPVTVIDSLTLTMGLGIIVLEAAHLAKSGPDLEELAAAVTDVRDRTHVFGLVDSLDHLRRGGRIGGAAHLLGSLLSIKPVLGVVGGRVEVESKQRTRARALEYLAGKARQAAPLQRLAVANGAASDINDFVSMLEGIECTTDVELGDLGPVVGTHTGPGSVGLCFITEDRKEG